MFNVFLLNLLTVTGNSTEDVIYTVICQNHSGTGLNFTDASTNRENPLTANRICRNDQESTDINAIYSRVNKSATPLNDTKSACSTASRNNIITVRDEIATNNEQTRRPIYREPLNDIISTESYTRPLSSRPARSFSEPLQVRNEGVIENATNVFLSSDRSSFSKKVSL